MWCGRAVVIDAKTGERFEGGRPAACAGRRSTASGEHARRKPGCWRSIGAAMVDMEAAAVARMAQMRGLEFRAVKAVSDEVDLSWSSTRFRNRRWAVSRRRVCAAFAWCVPWMWGQLIAARGADSTKAVASLKSAVER